MLEVDVFRFLVPVSTSSLGVVDEFGMDDSEYDFVDRLEVQEEDGS